MNLLLDTGILGQLCHPAMVANRSVIDWVEAITRAGSDDKIYLPEVCDFELRRKLLHLIRKGQASQRSIERLDELSDLLDYLPLDTPTMRKAAEFWSDSRSRGKPTSPDAALDGDVILAAQAAKVSGTVVTTNAKHLSQFVPAFDRTEIIWAYAFVCIRGPVDNLAFDWPDHFMVQDIKGRNWHCRHEATWHNRAEMSDAEKVLPRLMSDIPDVEPMYRKLFASGHGTTDPTTFQMPITISLTPISRQELFEKLAMELGNDSDDALT